MFIVHGGWFRRHMRWILAALLVVLIPGFVMLFSHTDSGDLGRRGAPKLRGKPVNPAEFEQVRATLLAQYLINSGGSLPKSGQFEENLLQDAMLRMICLRKAKEFGIRVTDEELVQFLRNQPFFRNEQGQFDPQRYQEFTVRLNNSRISEAQFEEVMRQQLLVGRLQELITSGAKVTPREVEQGYLPLHEKITVEYVEFDAAKNAAPITVSDEEVAAFYEKAKDQFRTPPLVKVRYARLAVDSASQVVSDQDVKEFYERNQAHYTNTLAESQTTIRARLAQSRVQRIVSDRATELSVKLVFEEGQPKPDLAAIAASYQAQIGETGFFSVRDTVPGVTAGEEFNQVAFALTPRAPYSDPVGGTNSYYILELLDRQPSAIPPLDQVRSQVIEQVRRTRAFEVTAQQGETTATRLKELLGDGKTFAAASAELKLTPELAAPFSLNDEDVAIPAAVSVKEAALSMRVGDVSRYLKTATGGMVFHLKNRTPPDPAQLEKDRAPFAQRLLQRNRELLWNSWLGTLWREEQVDLGLPQRAPIPTEDS